MNLRARTSDLFPALRERKGCIVTRPGDRLPGFWLLVREGELRGLLAAFDELAVASDRYHEALERLVGDLETNSEAGAPEYAHEALK